LATSVAHGRDQHDALAFLGSAAATNLLIDNGFSAAITTNQIGYSGMPAIDTLTQLIGVTALPHIRRPLA
jgi:hypothetical protein